MTELMIMTRADAVDYGQTSVSLYNAESLSERKPGAIDYHAKVDHGIWKWMANHLFELIHIGHVKMLPCPIDSGTSFFDLTPEGRNSA